MAWGRQKPSVMKKTEEIPFEHKTLIFFFYPKGDWKVEEVAKRDCGVSSPGSVQNLDGPVQPALADPAQRLD